MAGLGSDREAGGDGLPGHASCSHFVIWLTTVSTAQPVGAPGYERTAESRGVCAGLIMLGDGTGCLQASNSGDYSVRT